MKYGCKILPLVIIAAVVIEASSYFFIKKSHAATEIIAMSRKLHIDEIDPYIIQCVKDTSSNRFDPTVANGYIGYRIYGNTIYKNGLYNGKEGMSHRARIPNTLPYVLESNVTSTSKVRPNHLYLLNMKLGFYSINYDYVDEQDKEKTLFSVSQTFYAHKVLTRLLVTNITISFNVAGSIVLPLSINSGAESKDIKFLYLNMKMVGVNGASAACGHTLVPEQEGGESLHVCYYTTDVPANISVDGNSGEKYTFTFITSIADNLDEAKRFYVTGLEMLKKGALFSSHSNEWLKTWQYGSLLLEGGDITQMHSTVSGLYYLLSSFPPISISEYSYEFFGASPGGLTNGGEDQDYWGHVFWDQDFWMLPALLPSFPDAVKHGIEYRVARLSAAREKASSFGFRGAMYPWESAYTGLDVCPGSEYRKYEQHVTGDLVHIIRQYLYVTDDFDFLFKKIPDTRNRDQYATAWDVIYETSIFWLSRAKWSNEFDAFVINNVMGPDEYHSPVNNSAFTNEVALQNMAFALEVADMYNISLPDREKFEKVIRNLFLPYDSVLDYHPEFTGFNHTTDKVKQADAIMLGFPLMSKNILVSSRKNDLAIYSKATVSDGPAMTWGMFSINYNSLREYSKADEYFLRQYKNIQPPYQIWSEEPCGKGAVNFLTGIGGYLQSIIYGYLGLRIHKDHITVEPRLPPGLGGKPVTDLKLTGLKFKCATLDIRVTERNYVIKLVGYRNDSNRCVVLLQSKDVSYELSTVGDEGSFDLKMLCKFTVK